MKYLWDTNAVIYYLHDLLPEPNAKFFDQICLNGAPCFSVITEIELLSWQSTAKEELEIIQSFIQNSLVLEITPDIKSITAEIRKKYKLKLPDAIISATAVSQNLTLLTRNIKDFQKVEGLKLMDIWSEA